MINFLINIMCVLFGFHAGIFATLAIIQRLKEAENVKEYEAKLNESNRLLLQAQSDSEQIAAAWLFTNAQLKEQTDVLNKLADDDDTIDEEWKR